jgi:hypothetical protein
MEDQILRALREIRDLLADGQHEQRDAPRDPRLVVRVPPMRRTSHAAGAKR